MELNKIYNESNIETCKRLEDNSVDMILTSPPYDDLKKYKGYSFDFEPLAKELYRILKPGGIMVWVVGDATHDGSETCTSFRQALFFVDCGFKLHDTMIYEKNTSTYPAAPDSNRYTQIFEYMFIFSKGKARKDITLIADKENKWAGASNWGKGKQYNYEGKLVAMEGDRQIADRSPRTNIWKYTVGFNDRTGHPAVFPEQLAEDHILTWSREGETVYDPFMGSGTTAKMAYLNGRNYIGSEISSEYCKIISERMAVVERFDGKVRYSATRKKEVKADSNTDETEYNLF